MNIFDEINSYFEYHERPWDIQPGIEDESYKENCYKCVNRDECKVFCKGEEYEEEEEEGEE